VTRRLRLERTLETALVEKFAKAERKLPGKGVRRASRLCDEPHRRPLAANLSGTIAVWQGEEGELGASCTFKA
jgi:hypothetical protein